MARVSGEGDEIDFDADVAGEARDLDGGARGRTGREKARVNFVHFGELAHVLEKDGGADGFFERRAGGFDDGLEILQDAIEDRKSTRLNSSHPSSSYAVFCLKKKRMEQISTIP